MEDREKGMKIYPFLRERMLGDMAELYDLMLDYDQAVRHGDFESGSRNESELCGRIDCLIDIIILYRSYLQERWAQEGCVPWYSPEQKKEA